MTEEPAERAEARAARQRVRRHVLLKGAHVALSLVTVGLVSTWLVAGWTQSAVIGLIVGLLLLATSLMDRTASAEVAHVRRAVWLAIVAGGLAAVAVAALAQLFVARQMAFFGAGLIYMAVWAAVAWRVDRS